MTFRLHKTPIRDRLILGTLSKTYHTNYAHVERNIKKTLSFVAYYGRKANTALTNITSKPNINNLNWSNTPKKYSNDNIIGEEELISQVRWYDEDLDSDTEVQEANGRKLQQAKDDEGEVPRIINFKSAKFEEPLARNSPRLQLA